VRLAFAHDKLQAIAESDEPALAGENAHFANLIYIH
jgi:hypothetical protein